MNPRSSFVVSVGVAACALVACNVFLEVQRCGEDADCRMGETCDSEGRYCVAFHPPVRDADADGGSSPSDAPVAGPSRCDARAPFTSFALVRGFEGTTIISARPTPDETAVLYSSAADGCVAESCYDIYVAHRPDRASPFGPGSLFPALNCSTSSEYWPTLSLDGKLVFFESSRALAADGGTCGNDRARIWSASRPNTTTDFGSPRIDELFSRDAGSVESSPYLHPSGRSLYFVSVGRSGPGGQDIFEATIDTLGLVFQTANIAAVNTPGDENFPVISFDERTLFFARDQGEGTPRDIWAAHRASPGDAFDAPEVVAELATKNDEIPAWTSDDRCRLYFIRQAGVAGGSAHQLWVAERTPK